ncbi:MAG: alpha/beta hydrolase [Actinomycetota bacterium]|nr:MAG: alpha/beta hydrolase [Actinomycetota bacterium]
MERDFAQQWMQDWLIRSSGTSVNAESGRRRYPEAAKSEVMLPKVLGSLGMRQKKLAEAAAVAGHRQTALKIYELSLRSLIEAQHNIFSDVPLKKNLMSMAQECMDAIIGLAGHTIERLTIPFHGQTLPAFYHYRNESDPLLVYIPGMDGTKETSSIGPLASPFLSRGFRVIAMDGPGQGEARTLNGVLLRTDNYVSALRAVLDHLQSLGRWSGDGVWVIGSSLGTRWALEFAASDNRVKGLALLHAAFGDLGPLMFSAPPRFHKVLGYMTDLNGEALDKFIQESRLEASMKVDCPTLVCIGEFDPLTTLAEARVLYRDNLAGSKELLVFEDAFHGSDGLDCLGGMNGTDLAADWILDRCLGKPVVSGEFLVGKDSLGPYSRQPLTMWQTSRENL